MDFYIDMIWTNDNSAQFCSILQSSSLVDSARHHSHKLCKKIVLVSVFVTKS